MKQVRQKGGKKHAEGLQWGRGPTCCSLEQQVADFHEEHADPPHVQRHSPRNGASQTAAAPSSQSPQRESAETLGRKKSKAAEGTACGNKHQQQTERSRTGQCWGRERWETKQHPSPSSACSKAHRSETLTCQPTAQIWIIPSCYWAENSMRNFFTMLFRFCLKFVNKFLE